MFISTSLVLSHSVLCLLPLLFNMHMFDRNVTGRTAESQAQERQTDSRTEAREVPSPYVTAVPVEDKLSVILSNSIYSTYYSPTSTHTYTAA